MPTFSTEVPHQLGTATSHGTPQAVRGASAGAVQGLRHRPARELDDNLLTFSFKTYGFKIDGTLTVDETAARLSGNLPFAALAFRGKIEQSIASELRRELAS